MPAGVSPRVAHLGAAGFGAEGEQPTSPTSQHSAWGAEQHSNATVDMPDDAFSNKSVTGLHLLPDLWLGLMCKTWYFPCEASQHNNFFLC